jgi:hypothetical protein
VNVDMTRQPKDIHSTDRKKKINIRKMNFRRPIAGDKIPHCLQNMQEVGVIESEP